MNTDIDSDTDSDTDVDIDSDIDSDTDVDSDSDIARPAVRSARATRPAPALAVPPAVAIAVPLALTLAAALALSAPTSRPARGQAPTPQPQTTSDPTPAPTPVSVPERTARPPGFSVLGVLPACTFHASLTSSPDAVIAGDPVTMTVTTDIECPQQLDRRAAVVIVGSRTHASIRDVRASLALLVEHMAAGRGTRLALVEVGTATGPAPWASTPAEIAALDERVRRLEVLTVLDEAAWMDAIAAAETLLGSARPTERPLLIVLDSWGPVSGQANVVERLQQLAGATRDRVGQAWLLDVSTTGWLAGRIFRPVPNDGTVVALFPGADLNETLEHLLHRLVVSAAAPITLVDIVLSVQLPVGDAVPETAPTAEDATNRKVRWMTPGTGHRMAMRYTAVFRTIGPRANGGADAEVAIERTLPALRSSLRTGANVCVDAPPPSPATCRRAVVPPTATPRAVPTALPTASPTASPTAVPLTATPTIPSTPSSPAPSATPAASPGAPTRALWLPIGMRDR